jgi:molecular chaperone GrpE (heat shock protein)
MNLGTLGESVAFPVRMMKEDGVFFLGFLFSAAGFFAAGLGLFSMIFGHLNLMNLGAAVSPLLCIGTGILLAAGGLNLMVRPDRTYAAMFVGPLMLFSLSSVLFLLGGYPQAWIYPLVSYLFFFYALGVFLLLGGAFYQSMGRERDPPRGEEVAAGIEIREGEIPLLHWKAGEGEQIARALEGTVGCLVAEREELRMLLSEARRKSETEYKKLLLGTLEVMDAFDDLFQRIDGEIPQADERTRLWMSTVKIIRKKIALVLAQAGVSELEAPAGKASPGAHTIIEARPMEGMEDYTILEELQKGYAFRGEVLRSSKVIVVKNPERKERRKED